MITHLTKGSTNGVERLTWRHSPYEQYRSRMGEQGSFITPVFPQGS